MHSDGTGRHAARNAAGQGGQGGHPGRRKFPAVPVPGGQGGQGDHPTNSFRGYAHAHARACSENNARTLSTLTTLTGTPPQCPRCGGPLARESWGDLRCDRCPATFIPGGDGVLRTAAEAFGGKR